MATIPINMKTGDVERESEPIVGIDLGTTNSLVAFIRDGAPVCITEPDGTNTLVPSVVHFDEQGQARVGEAAKQRLMDDPANTIYSVKRLMGKSYFDVREHEHHFGYEILDDQNDESLVKIKVRNRYYTPVELSALILAELKQRAQQALGTPVSKAVITVPAYFNDTQRQATRDAGKLAGLDVLRIINEPTAAALAYGIGQSAEAPAERIAVFDLGGGTFDVSILDIQDGIFEVLSTHGDTYLGGDDFDRALVEHWASQLDLDDAARSDRSLTQALRLLAEEAKKTLSAAPVFEGQLRGQTLSISRETFEDLIAPFLQRTLEACRQALLDAGLQTSDINRVVMVGGSTRIPRVKQMVAAYFGKPVYDQLNPDEVVALGAAVQADILAGNQKEVLLLDVTPLSLGIETVGGLMDVIIPRNAKIPGKAGRQYTTSVDGQANLMISVYQGERDLVEHNRKLGAFMLRGIPPMPAGLPKIDVQFILNADGILTVKASELRSGVTQQIDIRPTYGISEEDMARMLLDSIQHAQEDMSAKALQEARNEANNLLLSGDKFIAQNSAWLSEAQQNELKRLLDALRLRVAGHDKDAIRQAIEELNVYATPLAHRAMDQNIGAALQGKAIG